MLRHVLCWYLCFLEVIVPVEGQVQPSGQLPDASATTTAGGRSNHHGNTNATPSPLSNGLCPRLDLQFINDQFLQRCLLDGSTIANTASAAHLNVAETTAVSGANDTIAGTLSSSAGVVASTGTEVDEASEASITGPSSTLPPSATLEAVPTRIIETTLTSTTTTLEPVAEAQIESETDSPLDGANFLSFEEWKNQNLAKAGQSPDHVGQARSPVSGDRQRPGINNALDAFGEDSEIDLDFSGFVGGRSSGTDRELSAAATSSTGTAVEDTSSPPTALRSRDAGRTCKERSNYASFDCAANVLKSNTECKSSSSILVESKDSYMLNTCSAKNKFLIVELCNDILIDTIVLANYEFFSSGFRHVRVSVSDRYPVKLEKWRDLGTFEARNTREVQAFLVENPLIWARYLRLEFLTHYGNEYYCPVSLLRVHGTTMMQEFRHQEEVARGEVSDDDVEEAEPVPPRSAEDLKPLSPTLLDDKPAESVVQPTITADDTISAGRPQGIAAALVDTSEAASRPQTGPSAASDTTLAAFVARDSSRALMDAHTVLTCPPSATGTDAASQPVEDVANDGIVTNVNANANASSSPASVTTPVAVPVGAGDTSTAAAAEPHVGNKPTSLSQSSNLDADNVSTNASTISNRTTPVQPDAKPSAVTAITSAFTTNTTRHVPVPTTSHQSQPPTQESFFKSMNKRLQQLESNSTLSLQYIEEQSRILRDAFSKVEKRQIAATTKFLNRLNETVMSELHGFRDDYNHLWQSHVSEREDHKEQYQREMLALGTRLTLVADELVWQKRMGIVQSTLLLMCLGFVLFGRQNNGFMDMPLAQQLMNRSQAAFRVGSQSPSGSPASENRSPVSLFRRKLWRSSMGPANEIDSAESRPQTRDGLDVQLEPPTPNGGDTVSDTDEMDEDEYVEELKSKSEPPTPSVAREEKLGNPMEWPDSGTVSDAPAAVIPART